MPKHVLLLLVALMMLPECCRGQGETTSGIAGVVRDESGAPVGYAKITVSSNDTGLKRSVETDVAGRFALSQLMPGSYRMEAEATGFAPQVKPSIEAVLGRTQAVDFVMSVQSLRQAVTVTDDAAGLDTDNPNTATTLNSKSLANLPNPGGDLTQPLQFASGALINTAGSGNDFVGGSNGYGNVEFNGLPALANGYIVDGLETNDPLTNLNSGLATNLVLGLNSISEVTVNTLSYAVDQGRYGAAQVNYVTKSGSNQFHGNLYELWNGSRLNAADFFTNATAGNHNPRSTVNHFGGSLGGPIVRDKLFFFFDSEWVKIALPIVTATTVPTTALESYVLQQLPLGGRDTVTGAEYGAEPQLVPFYEKLFQLYGNMSGTPLAMLGCPFEGNGSAASGNPPNGDGCAKRQSVSHSSDDHEQVQTARIDYNISSKDMQWYRFQADTGVQSAWSDPINPLFDAVSSQPLYSFASGFTHVFSANLVNYFNPAFSWYSSLFGPANPEETLSAFPIVLAPGSGASAPFTRLGGLDNTWIQGRRASRFFLNDNLAWDLGAHELRFGTNTRIFRLNDYDFGEGTVPTVTYADLPQFIYGVASTASETYPVADSQPFRFLNVDLYAQDTWKVTSTMTWTLGVRVTHNSNPLNPHDDVARLPSSFAAISHDVNQPLSALLETNVGDLFHATPLGILQPRTAIAWQMSRDTVLRTGFGLFSDLLPGSIADLLGANPPYVNTFEGGLFGTVGGTAIAPGVPNSAVDATALANQTFLDGFKQGELSCASPQANANACLPPVSLTAAPPGKLHAPYFMQWSFALERKLGDDLNVRAQYVGTRAVNQPYTMEVNGYQSVCAGCFSPFPYEQAVDPRFGAVTQLSTGANSHYHGLQLTADKRLGHGLQAQLNYTWSHCIDTVSNGGFLQFSAGGILSPLPYDLQRDRGPCDYDIRNNVTGNYVYRLPFKVRNQALGAVLNGWQISGSVFFHTGVPFSVVSSAYSANENGIVNGSGPQFASVVPGVPLYEHNSIPGVTQAGTIQWLNPNAFVSVVDPGTGSCVGGDNRQQCQFGDLGRNAVRGPDFVWSDFYLTKWFALSERMKLRIEGQFFNVLNHPNFALPSVVAAGVPGNPATQTGFGAITATTSPPTGLLGVGLGGDSSPRMIAFQARLEF